MAWVCNWNGIRRATDASVGAYLEVLMITLCILCLVAVLTGFVVSLLWRFRFTNEWPQPARPIKPNDPTTINPGIIKLVAWLNSQSFETTDSGDGKTHDFECDRAESYVVIKVEPSYGVMRADLLWAKIKERFGIEIQPISENTTEPAIQLTYDPANQLAFIDLTGLDDSIFE